MAIVQHKILNRNVIIEAVFHVKRDAAKDTFELSKDVQVFVFFDLELQKNADLSGFESGLLRPHCNLRYEFTEREQMVMPHPIRYTSTMSILEYERCIQYVIPQIKLHLMLKGEEH